ncbi:hypothetical protein ADUPG1_012355 [Aduncisulcus paluster]|uniref:CoA-binding domain-containing protein n=1 Tax=Aduncisulcus paluster TaxID=2918883 RepID=A0ABQ5JZ66_9EUKA|nr:hypothetical protein ADUPG1_012355 [Aduncisulcus paluster]
MHTVAILGASDNISRYSYMAVDLLSKAEEGYHVIPINPAKKVICGLQSVATLDDVSEKIDTLSVYVKPSISTHISDQILRSHPSRVIFNPGTENPSLMEKLSADGVKVIEACTLVLQKSKQFLREDL